MRTLKHAVGVTNYKVGSRIMGSIFITGTTYTKPDPAFPKKFTSGSGPQGSECHFPRGTGENMWEK
jgi:hypothetical protein